MNPSVVAIARELHVARANLATAKRLVETVEENTRLSYGPLYAERETAKAVVDRLDAMLRGLAAESFRATQDAEPAPGVTVKAESVPYYDAHAALAFARTTGIALMLDVKAFEKVAALSPQAVDFVRFVPEPKVSVARDLSEAESLSAQLTPITTEVAP